MDIVKCLIDFGFYVFIVYFLMVVFEVLMVELIEIESKEIFDVFLEVFF